MAEQLGQVDGFHEVCVAKLSEASDDLSDVVHCRSHNDLRSVGRENDMLLFNGPHLPDGLPRSVFVR